MKIAIPNDTHAGIRNSSEIFIEQQELFYKNVFFPHLKEHGIKQILHLGDYYDNRKFINFKALQSNRYMFLEVLRQEGIVMDIIPGNHDVFYKNTNELNSLKELHGHYMNEVHIIMEPTVMEYGSLKMALLPWINPENYDTSMNFIRECKADWLGAHLELNGFEMLRGITNKHGIDKSVFSKFEQVLTGHFHVSSKQDNIWYLGSQMEFFWSDAHDPKYFHIVDTESREVEMIRNPHTLFQKVLYNDEEIDYNSYNDMEKFDNKFVKVVVINRKDQFMFDRFIDRVQNRNIHELKIAENFTEFLGENVEDEEIEFDDTSTIVDTYIDAVDTDLDKDKIKTQVRELMVEAQALESI